MCMEGYITSFDVTPASTDDRKKLRDPTVGLRDAVILADKGYIGEMFWKEMQGDGIYLMVLKRSNSKVDWSQPVQQLVFHQRRRVETVFSQLSGQLNAERCLQKASVGCVLGFQTRYWHTIFVWH